MPSSPYVLSRKAGRFGAERGRRPGAAVAISVPRAPDGWSRGRFGVASVGYVEGYYNRRRPHSSIGYEFPAAKMEAFLRRMDEMAEREAAAPFAA